VGYHLLLLIAVPLYFISTVPKLSVLIVALIMLFLTGLSITAGYHRLYSHRSYKVKKIAEWPLLFFATVAGEGSALQWAQDHRLHHKYSDTDKDPYTVKDGFFHAHFIWLFRRPLGRNEKVVQDLLRSKLLLFQDKYYDFLYLTSNIVLAYTFGLLLNDMLGSFLFIWGVRTLLMHHATWSINSFAHYWGERRYSKEETAVDNAIIALITFGEGYHSYHHCFATDYRNGRRWWHFDPTKWLIWTLERFKLAFNLRRVPSYTVKKKLILEDARGIVAKLRKSGKDDWADAVERVSSSLREKFTELNISIKKYRLSKDKKTKIKIKSQRKQISELWITWRSLLNHV